jgi:8-oxo-dGTP diphosphatase
MTILLVRHAHAGSREKWSGPGPDELRPLSRKGWRQAEGLIELLEEYDISRLLSSPYLRCVQTLEPLAHALGLEIERADALAEGAQPHETRELIRGLGDSTAALSTHGDVVPGILELLAADEVLELPPDYPYKKGSTWVLSGDHEGVLAARYLPPPPA